MRGRLRGRSRVRVVTEKPSFFKWSVSKDPETASFKAAEEPVAGPQTHTHTHKERKLIFQPGMRPGSPKLYRQQAVFSLLLSSLLFCRLLKIFASELRLTEGHWPAHDVDVCHKLFIVVKNV